MDAKFNNSVVEIEPPKKPKKITGTRFAAILGYNSWSTPFQEWCEITKTYNMPFEDTIYTLAGKTIEPKQIQYMRDAYAMDDNLIDPHDVWGKDPFKSTYGNFFTHPVFGGMWDALLVSDDWTGGVNELKGKTDAVLEFKTTKRVEDWQDDIPEYYALQAALYAWLLDCDNVIMVCSFLSDDDYEHPERFVPSADNTITREFRISERYPNWNSQYIKPAIEWWEQHVSTGISPEFDEHKDFDYLKELRKAHVNPDTDVNELLFELLELQTKVDEVYETCKAEEKRIKQIKDVLKNYAMNVIGDRDTCEISNGVVTCKLTRSCSLTVDENMMREDEIWDQYAVPKESFRFTVSIAK